MPLRQDPVRELRLGGYVARFEETPLATIRQKIGDGTLERDGDAASARRWLCYSLPGQLVWFISTEMGGSEDALMQVAAETLSPSDRQKCPLIPARLRPLTLKFGWLGADVESVREQLGEPSAIHDDRMLYLFAGTEQGPYLAPGDTVTRVVTWDVTAYIELRIEGGKIVALYASHVTSY